MLQHLDVCESFLFELFQAFAFIYKYLFCYNLNCDGDLVTNGQCLVIQKRKEKHSKYYD